MSFMSEGNAMRRGGPKGDIVPKGYMKGQLQQFTPEQMNLFKQMFGQISPDSYTSRLAGGDESLFEEMERPAMRQFGELQGDIASRFSGMGMGSRHGSGFQNSMNQATSDFAQDLQSKRQSLQRQAIQDLMGMSSDLLGQRPYEKFLIEKQHKPEQNSWWQGLLGAAGGGAAGYAMSGGNPMSALKGANAGFQIGNQFA